MIVVIIIRWAVAKDFVRIAFDKGYGKEAGAFPMCFLLGSVGYIYVAAMPKLTEDEIQEKRAGKIYREALKK